MKKLIMLLLMCCMAFTAFAKGATSKNGKFIVGMECNYAPFNWTQLSKTDTSVAVSSVDFADGYDVVIASYIAKELGLELEIKKIAWEGLIPALESGEIDAIIAGMTNTPERAKSVAFTDPYYESEMVIVVRKDDTLANVSSIQEFSGKALLGQMNTLYDEVIDQVKDVKHATPQQTYPRMVLSLQEKEVDGIIGELPVARGVVAANKDLVIVQFAKDKGFVADTTVSIAVKLNNKALKDAIQDVLNKINNDKRNQLMQEATERQPAVEG
ncbi:MAG: transporter substrate-binding domain-containing protein [Fusobacteriaceae bacterium]|nr:transporter substrate-binding domain-containing protein [Fusobacteriaceae bacterium]